MLSQFKLSSCKWSEFDMGVVLTCLSQGRVQVAHCDVCCDGATHRMSQLCLDPTLADDLTEIDVHQRRSYRRMRHSHHHRAGEDFALDRYQRHSPVCRLLFRLLLHTDRPSLSGRKGSLRSWSSTPSTEDSLLGWHALWRFWFIV